LGEDSVNTVHEEVKTEARAWIVPAGFFLFVSLTLLCVFCGSAQTAAKVQTVGFSGNRLFSRARLADVIGVQERSFLSDSLLKRSVERLLEFYRNEGYIFAQVDSVHVEQDTERNEVNILFALTEGEPAVVRRLEFEGNVYLSTERIRSCLDIKEGDRLVPDELERSIGSVLKAYEQSGYPLTAISIQDVSFIDSAEEMSATVRMKIDEGSSVRISELHIEGNKTTKEYVITREARLRDDELFFGDLPARIKRRLDRLQLFSSVSLPDLYLTKTGQAGLLIKVAEGNQNYFDGVLGYLPAVKSGESGYLTGLVNVQLRNLLGTGRRLSARWYQENQKTQEIELHYLEPWVASYPVNVQLGFFQRKQDSTFVQMQYDCAADFMITEDFSVGASFTRMNVYPTAGFGGSVMPASSTTSLGLSVHYDSRDDPITPMSGILYSTEYQTGTKQTVANALWPGSKSATQRIAFDLGYYLSPIRRQVLATEFHIRDFSSSHMDLSDLFRLGGATSLRGYREGQFLGSRLIWSNVEYRFLVAPRSFFLAFVDAGYIVRPGDVIQGLERAEQSKVGYGIGVRMDSALGLIGVNFAFGEGDTFGTAKVHIRLVNEF
jgi:outer membrane protein insertion porin family